MHNLTNTAALELRPHGIRVNSVLPGFAETALVTGNKTADTEALGVDFDAVIGQAQAGYVAVEDVAAVALFLAGDWSAFCTCAGYVVDGRLTPSLIRDPLRRSTYGTTTARPRTFPSWRSR